MADNRHYASGGRWVTHQCDDTCAGDYLCEDGERKFESWGEIIGERIDAWQYRIKRRWRIWTDAKFRKAVRDDKEISFLLKEIYLGPPNLIHKQFEDNVLQKYLNRTSDTGEKDEK